MSQGWRMVNDWSSEITASVTSPNSVITASREVEDLPKSLRYKSKLTATEAPSMGLPRFDNT